MSIIEDFKQTFGAEIYEDVLSSVHNHDDMSSGEVPEQTEQKLFFSLMKMIDFECFVYGCAPKGLKETEVKSWLKKHAREIKCEPSSAIGLMCGVFNFLVEGAENV